MIDKTRLLASNGQYSRYPLSRFWEELRRLELSKVDFVPQTPHFWCGHTHYEQTQTLKAALTAAGAAVAALTPPPYRYSITAPHGPQRQATLDYYRNCVALAGELGCGKVVLGGAGACWDLDREALLQNAAEILGQLCPLAQKNGVALLLAPVMGPDAPLIAESPVLGTARELAGLLERVDHPSLGVCLDTNVMSVNGDDIPGWFAALGEKTGLARLCDGNYHGWRAWGTGCLPMEGYLAQLEKAGYGGEISLLLPGERYIEEPWLPERAALSALEREV